MTIPIFFLKPLVTMGGIRDQALWTDLHSFMIHNVIISRHVEVRTFREVMYETEAICMGCNQTAMVPHRPMAKERGNQGANLLSL